MHSTRFVSRAAIAACAFVPLLAACGQKGPLVLPDTDTSGVVIRPQASPAPPAAPPASTSPTPTPPAPRTDDDTPAPRH